MAKLETRRWQFLSASTFFLFLRIVRGFIKWFTDHINFFARYSLLVAVSLNWDPIQATFFLRHIDRKIMEAIRGSVFYFPFVSIRKSTIVVSYPVAFVSSIEAYGCYKLFVYITRLIHSLTILVYCSQLNFNSLSIQVYLHLNFLYRTTSKMNCNYLNRLVIWLSTIIKYLRKYRYFDLKYAPISAHQNKGRRLKWTMIHRSAPRDTQRR